MKRILTVLVLFGGLVLPSIGLAEDGVTPGRSPLINLVGPEPLFVTKISDNPFIPVTKAKMLACDFDLHVTF